MLRQVVFSILILLVVPFLTGTTVCSLLKIKNGIAGKYLFGSMAEWAFIQLVSVPLIIFRQRFTIVVIILTVFLGLMSVAGLLFLIRDALARSAKSRNDIQKQDVFVFILMILGYIAMAMAVLFLQTKSFDDSRFVVTAIDIVKTDRMLLTNPNNGLEITEFLGDMHRDAVSPWAVYIAYCARTTGVYTTIMAHTILPQTLMLCMTSAYWLIADTFFHKNRFSKCAMVFIALLVNVYGGYTGYNAETFALTRIWQGKAVVASIGIPTLFLCFALIYEQPDCWANYILTYIVTFAMCLFSGMGIIISGIMCGGAGIALTLLRKKVLTGLKTWIAVMIPLAYYVISKLNY